MLGEISDTLAYSVRHQLHVPLEYFVVALSLLGLLKKMYVSRKNKQEITMYITCARFYKWTHLSHHHH